MLTFFTTAKAFRGHDGIIQRNALKSWKLLHPDVEVILFGDDEGAAEVCAELGLVHHPEVERHESGAKRLDYMFRRANEVARHGHLCFSNCDIVLMQDFWSAFTSARSWQERFLMVSQRWDVDVEARLDFGDPAWAENLRRLAVTQGFQQNHYWIDLFLFSKGLYLEMPPLIVGHCYWDNWMIWKALQEQVAVVDATRVVVPVHQNHGYSAKYGRVKGLDNDPLSQENLKLIGGPGNIRTIRSATHYVARSGAVRLSARPYTDPVREFFRRIRLFGYYRIWLPTFHFLLNATRRPRTVLGLRSKSMRTRSENQPSANHD